jgi:hypothetical protein
MTDKKISQLTASTTPLAGTETLPIVQSGETKKVSVADLTVGRVTTVSRIIATGGLGTPSSNAQYGWNSTQGAIIAGTGTSYDVLLQNKTNQSVLGIVTGTRDAEMTAGNLRFSSGKGIDFSADANAAGMTSELLNDYEVGTWTPVYSGLSGSIGSTAYATNGQLGRYTKIGNVVYVSARVVLSNKGSWTGTVLIGGLPFAPLSSPNPNPAVGAIETRFVTFSEYLVTNFSASGVFIAEMVSGGQVTNLDASAVANNSGFIFTGFYIIN